MGSTWKGSTKIILKDVNTGKESITKDENVFKADNIARFCRSMGYFNCSPLRSIRDNDLWTNLLGGLYIFDNNISEQSKYMPAGTRMIGRGAYNKSNNSAPRELGSWNNIESTVSDGELVLVWDFTTSQANGTIKCVSLGSRLGGLIGLGNPSGDNGGSLGSVYEYRDSNYPIPGNDTNSPYKFNNSIIIDNNAYFDFSLNLTGGSASFKKRYLYTESIDLSKGTPKTNAKDETISISFDPISDIKCTRYHCDDDKLYVIAHTYSSYLIPSGGTFTVLIFKPAAGTCEKKVITNPLETAINASSRRYMGINPISENNYLVASRVNSNTYNLYLINSESSDYTLLIENASTSSGYIYGAEWWDNIGYFSFAGSLWLVDLINKTCFPLNISGNYQASDYNTDYGNETSYNKQLDAFTYQSVATNPFYLATINNLESPVTKTSNQTMKVIYTLTRQQS